MRPGHARRIQLGEAAGEFALPNIVVLTVRNGQIARLHDYVNVLAAAGAVGAIAKRAAAPRDHRRIRPPGPGRATPLNRDGMLAGSENLTAQIGRVDANALAAHEMPRTKL